MGSFSLFGLYMLFKMFNKAHINLLLTGYFFIIGVMIVTSAITPLFKLTKDPVKLVDTKVSIPYLTKKPIDIKINLSDVLAFIVACLFGTWYIMTKHWLANNIFGITFSIHAISSISYGQYKVGAIVLVSYDIHPWMTLKSIKSEKV